MTPRHQAASRSDIGDYLISARSFAEYRAMFALTDDDLSGRILDCPGGGASFTATAAAQGTDAVAVDPVYATPADQLAGRMEQELARGSRWAAENAGRYVWHFYGDPAGHARMRAESARSFTTDVAEHPERYVAGALPDLPFADDAVDLVLSSHLLFTYADRLDADFHLAALLEMVRISRGEIRVYPLVDQAGRPLPELIDRLATELASAGVRAEVRPVGYEFQRGATELLRLRAAR